MRISVIVPVYKVEKYIRRCIDSILAQTYEDFELILVDDGSPDDCGNICDEYAVKDNRIKVIHKDNGGLSSARNAGLDWVFEFSDSQFITFIDSDDYVDKNYLYLLLKALVQENADVSCCRFTEDDERSADVHNTNILVYGGERFCVDNYFYSHDMPATSGELKVFDLYYITDNELVLVYPMHDKIDFTFRNRIYNTFKDYNAWAERIGINYVADVNKVISKGHIRDLITKNNLKIDMDIHDICKEIIDNKKRIVLLAGPSSSGKTTTSKRVSLCLSAMGYDAIPLSLDDFFLEKDETPLDENGNKDFESVRALDLDLFTNSLNNLLKGEEVKLPTYNFVKGIKEFNNPPIKLKDNQMIVIEGLHAINPEILKRLDTKVIYKVYISPLTPLAVDRHNYISTTDNRLLRRIIRDFRTRGRSAEQSLASWQSVRDGEEKYIFPYTDTVDGIINTAYVYEIGVLKVFVEPLLYDIKMDSPYYNEARRLLDNLKSSYSISSEYIESDNVLREFIGGSIFE